MESAKGYAGRVAVTLREVACFAWAIVVVMALAALLAGIMS